ncbi:MAG: hypothetical protein WA869_28795, partial [Alloacidobacterium sp.]
MALSTNTISLPLRAHQGGDAVVYIGDATLCFGRSLVIADGGLARQVAHHRLYDRTRRQRSARIVEVEGVGHTGRFRSELRHVERQRTGSARAVSRAGVERSLP